MGSETKVEGRLVALACPEDVVRKRLKSLENNAKKRQRKVSEQQREICPWTVLFSNVSKERMKAEDMWEVYRLRWQIELLFKRFKSEGGLGTSNSEKRDVVEAEWYAKLLGQVIRNWVQLLRGGPLCDVNQKLLGQVIANGIGRLAEALRERNSRSLEKTLRKILTDFEDVRPRTRRKTRKTAAAAFAQMPS